MQNLKLYILFGFLGAFIMVAVLRGFSSTKTDRYGLSYKEIDQKSVVLNPQYFQTIQIKNEKGTFVLKAIDDHPKTGHMSYIQVQADEHSNNDPVSDILENWNLFLGPILSENMPEEEVYVSAYDSLHELDLAARKTLFSENNFVLARSYVPPNYAADDWFTKIEDSPFIFIPMAIIPFLLLLLHDLLIFFFSNKKRDRATKVIQLTMITLAIGFFFSLMNPTDYAASRITQIILCVLIMYPLYFIFQRELPLIEKWDIKHNWKEDYKFLVIVVGGTILVFLANIICRFIDSNIFNSDGYTILEVAGRRHLEIGIVFSFALGNLLNNIRKYIIGWWRKSKKLTVSETKAMTSEAELNAVQASVNPHFLYNSLNSIASLAKTDPQKTEEMAIALSKFYKYNTNRDQSVLSTIDQEIDLLKTYLEIEKIRFEDKLHFELNLDPNLNDVKIPHFLLQPIVENAIKYGYQKSTDKIWVKVDVSANANNLQISIFDKGEDFNENLHSGYGLKSVMKKLEVVYPNQHSMEFINTPEKHVLIILKNVLA